MSLGTPNDAVPPAGPAPELMAPAGGPAALQAALASGADAVYFGLRQLNARRGAENFGADTLGEHVAAVHARGARAYLTLNIDLTQRELGQAARHLELARRARVDAVIIRDPAFLAFRPLYPELEFHASTQAGICNSAGVTAARELGLRRVILARELTLDEIRAAAAVAGIATEVFVQGALCYSASGRCLLSSWVGGRSGNRGCCASPCRVPWTLDGAPAGRPLSMHDLCLATRLGELRAAGVRALKIEGRLKTADWVARAVTLYRAALAGTDPAGGQAAAAALGDYTGRAMTDHFLDGNRRGLTGDAGRRPASVPGDAEPPAPGAAPGPEPVAAVPSVAVSRDAAGGLNWVLAWDDRHEAFRTPPQRVRRAERAVTLEVLRDRLAGAGGRDTPVTVTLDAGVADLMLPRSIANGIERNLITFMQRCRRDTDDVVRLDLPVAVRALLAPAAPAPQNYRRLGERPDRVRLDRAAVPAFATVPELGVIVEAQDADDVAALRRVIGHERLVVALPTVFYESDLARLDGVVDACRRAGMAVEANSYDGWWLCRRGGVRCEGGPGLMVLNALAAAELGRRGCAAVTASLEADRRQLEELCAACPVPLAVVVYGRPPLLQTRVELGEQALGRVFADSRGVQMRARREGSVTVFRPVAPFDWCGLRNDRVHARHLVMDLRGADDPCAEWAAWGRAGGASAALRRFNYERTLR